MLPLITRAVGSTDNMLESCQHAFPSETQVAPWSIERSTPKGENSPIPQVLACPVGMRLGTGGGGNVGDGSGGGGKVGGGGGNVGDREGVAVGAAHPAKNTTTIITPSTCCRNFGLFILCSFRCDCMQPPNFWLGCQPNYFWASFLPSNLLN